MVLIQSQCTPAHAAEAKTTLTGNRLCSSPQLLAESRRWEEAEAAAAVALEGAQSTHAASWQLMAGLLSVRGDLSAARQVCDAGLAKTAAFGVCACTSYRPASRCAGALHRTLHETGLLARPTLGTW